MAGSYLAPGVYMEEVDRGPRPIEGVGTAVAAFIGFAAAGPYNTPEMVTNWSQYVEKFGHVDASGKRKPHADGFYLSHAVYGYFLNGGGRCYVVRIQTPSESAQEAGGPTPVVSRATPGATAFLIQPQKDKAVDQDLQVDIIPPTGENPPEGSFTLKVRLGNKVLEEYPNVTMGKGERNAVQVLKEKSSILEILESRTGMNLATRTPELGTYPVRARTAITQVKPDDFVGDPANRTGLGGLQVADDVTMVVCPDIMSAYQKGWIDRNMAKAIQLGMINHCEQMGDRVAILDPLPGLKPLEAKTWREVETNFDSKYAALYYPWIMVSGPDGKDMAIPPSGHIAGIWARNDSERGVHKAPANEIIRGVTQLESKLTSGEQEALNPVGVNCIRNFTGRGVRVWGARTLSSDPAWKYVNVRRLFNYVERSIESGTQWVVFEPNDPDLWARVSRDVHAFLTTVWMSGALFGRSPDEAFYVKCDDELNPPELRDQGKLIIEIGLAPVKPAEFVIFRLSQWAGGGA